MEGRDNKIESKEVEKLYLEEVDGDSATHWPETPQAPGSDIYPEHYVHKQIEKCYRCKKENTTGWSQVNFPKEHCDECVEIEK